jgi:aldehyde dehydrogenase (NAD+)
MPNTFLFTIREPLGVVSLITPWNFPIAIPAWKMAPALVSGNTVVFKPATLTPLTALNLVQCLEEAGIPPGVVNLVTGPGSTVGEEIINHQQVRAVSFTGSHEVGRGVYGQVSRRAVKCQCEMGGKNPIIVLEDADLDKATDVSIDGAFWSTGRKCTAASRVIVLKPILEDYLKLMVEKTEKLVVGDGMKDATQVGPLVDQSQLDRTLDYIRIGNAEGARLLTGGKRLEGPEFDQGYFVQPTIFADVTPQMRIAQEEIFGPVLSVISAKTFDEAIQVANGIRFGLSASIVTQNLSRVFQYVNRIQAGQVHINATTAGAECHVPFGGVKDSSTGIREQGSVAIDFYSQLKTVYLHY